MNYRIIDAHTHVFPDKIAGKAADSITDFYDFHRVGPASLERLLNSGDGYNVTNFLVCSAALSAHQTADINAFMAELNRDDRLICLGTINAENENYLEILEGVKKAGLYGIKLHPDFQKVNIDDKRLIPMYKEMHRIGLPILFHMGDNRYDYSSPTRLAHVLKEIPGLKCIAAHMGGYSAWDEALSVLPVSDNLYFDTSSALCFMDKALALKLIEKHGVEKFMFGTDYPIWKVGDEVQNVLALGLSEEENKKIFCENFLRFFGME